MTNRLVVFITIIAVILIIGIPTYNKVSDRYESRVDLTIKNKIKVKAIQCWNENRCLNDIVYLSDLYEIGYLDEVIDPITKKAISASSYVTKENGDIVINIFE